MSRTSLFKKDGESQLNIRQLKFCLEVFKGLSATQAAKNAGYSARSAGDTGYDLLKLPAVQDYIKRLHAEATDSSVMSVLERKHRLTEIARGKATDFIDEDGNVIIPEDGAGEIAEIKKTHFQGGKDGRAHQRTTTVKLHNPLTAIAELNKMEGAYAPEKVDHTLRMFKVVTDPDPPPQGASTIADDIVEGEAKELEEGQE